MEREREREGEDLIGRYNDKCQMSIFLKNMGYAEGEKWLTRSYAEGMEGIAQGAVDGGQGVRRKERGRVLRGKMAGIGKVFA